MRTLDVRLMGQADQTVCERERRVVPVQRLQGLDEVAAASLDAKLEELLAVGADGHARIQPHRRRCVEGGGTGCPPVERTTAAPTSGLIPPRGHVLSSFAADEDRS